MPLEFDPVGHAYTLDGQRVPSVTQVIRSALGDPFEHVARDILAFAQQRGRAVHRACELDDDGELDESTVDPRIAAYVEAWREFRRAFRFEVLFAECPLCAALHGFAGTPDCVIRFDDGALGVLDRKTGLPGVAAALQTAAYAELARIEVEQWGGPPRAEIRRYALRMLPTGRYQLHPYTSPRDWPDFLACLTTLRLKERIAA